MKVACDLFLNLRLYRVPDVLLESIKKSFPDVRLCPVNTPDTSAVCEDAEIYWGNRITAEIIDAMPYLKWIHFGSVGIDRANIESVRRRGIVVTNSRGLMVAPMVASALAFMCSLARGLHRCEALRKKGLLDRAHLDQHFDEIQDLAGQKCLIVGYGDVGKALAKACAALEMSVALVLRDNSSGAAPDWVADRYGLDEIKRAVADADYIVNLLPLTAQTKGVFNAEVFGAMKTSAYFVNIGRGQTVDEPALVDALAYARIAGAGLDVFQQEPLTNSSPLWVLDNVILTPHVAGLSRRYWERQGDLFIHNLGVFLSGDTKSMTNLCHLANVSGPQ